jgi:ParB family chromosome partitioning protein
MATAKARLGRGLSALLGDVDPTQSERMREAGEPPEPANRDDGGAVLEGSRTVPIGQLHRNPDQPRKRFDETELDELANSIKGRGLLQPILVRPIPGEKDAFQIVAGERRWRASQKAGLHEVPIVVRNLSDQEVVEIAIIENVQRADLNPIEEARGYQALIDQFGHTQEEIAKAIGKSRSHVANTLRLLALPPRVRDLLYDEKLSAGHARAIASAPDPENLAAQIVERGLTVRQAEDLARVAHEVAGTIRAGGRPSTKDADTIAMEKDVAAALGLDVDIRHKGEAGEIRIKYSQLEQLEEVCRRLRTAS